MLQDFLRLFLDTYNEIPANYQRIAINIGANILETAAEKYHLREKRRKERRETRRRNWKEGYANSQLQMIMEEMEEVPCDQREHSELGTVGDASGVSEGIRDQGERSKSLSPAVPWPE